jgi:opacity protein-like surface antigen
MLVVAFIATGISSIASAQGFDNKKLFAGAGLSLNKFTGSDYGRGIQVFGGYDFGEVAPKLHIDAEVGFMDTGKMTTTACAAIFGSFSCNSKATGLWATGVVRYMADPHIEFFGRAGQDIGDDDGFMFGAGAGYLINRNVKLRLEYVERQHVKSVQINAVYLF